MPDAHPSSVEVLCHNERSVCDGKWSRSRHAVILVIGCSLGAGPWRCDRLAPPDLPPPTRPNGAPPPPAAPPIATTPRRDEPTQREPLGPRPQPPPSRVAIPEEVIMRAVRTLHPTFVACWKRAQRNDPSLVSARVRISLEVDASGAVTSSRTDAEDERLGRCLANVARKLAFPAIGRAAVLDVPLFF